MLVIPPARFCIYLHTRSFWVKMANVANVRKKPRKL
jgi:hypothetical protein